MTKRDIPENLKRKQEEKKKDTLDKIDKSIDTILSENGIVTKKKLIEITGFSNATFSKEHVKELLKVKQVCQFANKKTVEYTNTKSSSNVALEINKLEKENRKLKDVAVKKDLRIDKLENDLQGLDDKYKRLLGKMHQLMDKANSYEINFDDIYKD